MMTNAPADWYPDPEYPGQLRYWDGTAWTVNRAPAPRSVEVAAAPSAPDAPAPANRDATPAVLALVLAIVGFVLGVLPFAAWFAWLAFVPALILAIRALVRRRAGRGSSISAIVVAGIGWLFSLVVGLGSFALLPAGAPSSPEAAAVSSSTPTASPTASAPPATPSAGPTPTVPALPGLGQAVTSRSGVSFTVTGVECGLGAQQDVFGDVAPKGQFCRIDFVVANGSTQPQNLSASDVFGYIGNARYEADSGLARFGDDDYFSTVNPGLSVDCTVFFDVPAGATLDRVKLITSWWGGDGATVTLR